MKNNVEKIYSELIRKRKANDLFCDINSCSSSPYMDGSNKILDDMIKYVEELPEIRINNIVNELIENNISVSIEYDQSINKLVYILKGFYKSDTIKLIETDDKLIAHARYEEETLIESLRDIVELNYRWWKSSKDRFEGWANPDSQWLPLLLKYGFIKEEIKVIKTYIY